MFGGLWKALQIVAIFYREAFRHKYSSGSPKAGLGYAVKYVLYVYGGGGGFTRPIPGDGGAD